MEATVPTLLHYCEVLRFRLIQMVRIVTNNHDKHLSDLILSHVYSHADVRHLETEVKQHPLSLIDISYFLHHPSQLE